jgi:hypothetical protein
MFPVIRADELQGTLNLNYLSQSVGLLVSRAIDKVIAFVGIERTLLNVSVARGFVVVSF